MSRDRYGLEPLEAEEGIERNQRHAGTESFGLAVEPLRSIQVDRLKAQVGVVAGVVAQRPPGSVDT